MTAPAHFPSSFAAETAVLSCLCCWPAETAPMLREEQVTEEWFFHLAPCFESVSRMVEAGRTIDVVTVRTQLADEGILEKLGIQDGDQTATGFLALTKLFTFAGGGALTAYIDILREKFLARRMLALASHIHTICAEQPEQAGMALVKTLTSAITDLASYGIRNDTVQHIKPNVWRAVEAVQEAFNARGNTLGLSWGIPSLDRMTRGIRAGFGYYIGGRPAMGKSAFMGDIADFIGTNADPFSQATALIFSIEMTADQLVQRSLMKRAYIPQQRVRDGLLSEDRDFPKLTRAAGQLAVARIHVDGSSTLTIDDLAARTRRFVRKHRAKETDEQRERRQKSERPDIVLFIDYLQRVKGVSKRAQQNRYLEVAEVATGISTLIKDLRIAAVVCVQLGRAENEGPDKFPSLSDMRESGDIENEAHVVIAMHRPVYYIPTPEKKQTYADKKGIEVGDKTSLGERDLEHLGYACILKQREGPTENIPIHFEPSLAQFSAWNGEETTFSTNKSKQQSDL